MGYGPAHDQGVPQSHTCAHGTTNATSRPRRMSRVNTLRVAVLTQWYPPEPAWQPQWIVEALGEAGADCRVVTGVPNYPTGQVLPGYQAWRRSEEVIADVPVLRTPLYPNHGDGALKRFANYGSWALSSAMLGRRDLKRADVVLVYSSPATAAAAAMVTRRLDGTPYVLLIQDLWPDSVTQSGMLPARWQAVTERALNVFVDASYRHAAAIVVISAGMKRLLVERGVDESKVSVVHNWVSEQTTVPGSSAEESMRERLGIPSQAFVLMYAGNHGAAQGLGPVLDAFRDTEENRHLVLVGGGIEKPRLQARAQGLPNVHFLERQPSSLVRAWMQEADAQLVSLVRQPLFAVTVPSKLQMALAEGCPVLAVAEGDVVDIVEAADAGVSALPGDNGSIKTAIDTMIAASPQQRGRWGANARSYYESTMAPEVGASRMMQVLRGAARPHVAPTIESRGARQS
jgi:colanic acid biosynthesis glycosyl transferase WcaI